MPTKSSKWQVVSASGPLEVDSTLGGGYSEIAKDFGMSQNPALTPPEVQTDNGLKSTDQERAEDSYNSYFQKEEQLNGGPLDPEELARRAVEKFFKDLKYTDPEAAFQQAMVKVQDYKKSLRSSDIGESRSSEPYGDQTNLDDQSTNVTQESVAPPTTGLGPSSPSAEQMLATAQDRISKYRGSYKKNKTKKHLKGEGPVADKANEIYHAIMRDKGKDEPSKKEQASAASIAWSKAKKIMKKKAYFRGEEAKVLDSYRGLWGEELVRVSVNNQIVDVPRDQIQFVSSEVVDPVAELRSFVYNIPEEANTKSQILANIHNLKIAKDVAYRFITSMSEDISESEEISFDIVYSSCDERIKDLEERLATFSTEEDQEYVDALPQYEMGKKIMSSSFSRDGAGWMDEVIEKMAAEAEEIDITKLANEDPLILVAGLSEEVIANAVAVRNMAVERVLEVAGPLDEETKQSVVSTYVRNAEEARRKRFSNIQALSAEEVQVQQRTANSTPDEGLFL